MTCAARYHGTCSAYTRAHCRCPEAREAWRLYAKRRRQGRLPAMYTDPLPTSRRLRALATQQWTWAAIAAVDGRSRHQITNLAVIRSPRILIANATRIEIVYDKLRDTRGPSRLASIIAARFGWPDPAYWDDYDITDPNVIDCNPDEAPDEILVERFVRHATQQVDPGEYRTELRWVTITRDVDRIAVVTELARLGLSESVIASRLNASPGRVRKLLAVAA